MEGHIRLTAGLTPPSQPPGRSRIWPNLLAGSADPAWNMLRSRHARPWAWPFLLLAGLIMHAPLAAGQESLRLPQSQLTPDVRSRVAEAARDSALAPWQREFMLGVARGEPESTATQPSPVLPGLAQPSVGIAADDGTWIALPPPTQRSGHTAIYDPVRDRMVVFGGFGDAYPHSVNDVWALSLSESPAWSVLSPTGSTPTGRYGHTAIYDPVRDRMVVFGGGGNDVWALSLAGSPAWSELTPAGTPPTGRFWHTAIYDPVHDRMVVFGGVGGGGGLNDVWALSLAGSPAWSELSPAGPPQSARYLHTAIYDPVRDRMVVFGGDHSGDPNDVWALTLSGSPAWSELTPVGTPPTGRYGHTAIYDPVRDRMVVFGGGGNDVWALSLAGSPVWSELAPVGSLPAERARHTAIYDPVRDRMVVYGGELPHRSDWPLLNDVWALSLAGSAAWSELGSAEGPPTGRWGHTAIYDPVRDRMVVFGGFDDSGGPRGDAWALSLAGSPAWSRLGTPQFGRFGHTAIYDPLRDRMIVFGGHCSGGSDRNDVWALSLSDNPTWSELVPAGTVPSERSGHAAIYDPLRDRMVVFGGDGGGNDVWALSLAGSSSWSELTPAGTPPPEGGGRTAIYDPVRDRMVVFGGWDRDHILSPDVWALSLAGNSAWSELTPAATPPPARSRHTAIYDPLRDRMVVFGGSWRNDVWALVWGTPVSDVAMAFDLTPNTLNLASHGLWVTGYLEPASPFAASGIDVASIRLNGTVSVDPAGPTAIGDHDGNGIPDLMVKFNRAAVELTLSDGDQVPVSVAGTVAGHAFSGTDYIRVRRMVVFAPVAGSHLAAGFVAPVLWQMPSGVTVESVALLQSLDGGSTWSLIARGQPNTGRYDWTVPNVQTDQAKVAVVLVESADSTGDVVDGVLGVSETFSIEGTVGVGDQGPAQVALALRGATPNPAAGGRPWVEFSLRDGSPAKLEMVDVTGRVLSTRQVGSLGPGTHALDLSEGGALPPGIYFLRLTQGASEVRGRIAILR